MSITLINPPEKLRVWAGISESMAYGVYCFPPLGLMYIQAAIEKYTPFKAEIYDGVVDDLDHADFDRGLAQYDLDVVGISAYTHSLPDVQMTINNVRKRNPKALTPEETEAAIYYLTNIQRVQQAAARASAA